QRFARWIQDREVVQARGAARRLRATSALPDVEPKVVMVAVPRQERRGVAHSLLKLQSKRLLIEEHRSLEVGDFEVHVTDHGMLCHICKATSGHEGGFARL